MHNKLLLRAYICALLVVLVCAACTTQRQRTQSARGPDGQRNNHIGLVVYLALGDSTGLGLGARNGHGYVDRLFGRIRQICPDARLINLSRAGATTADVLQQTKTISDEHATLVTLCVGLNDVLQEVGPEQFANNYEAIIVQIQQAGLPLIVTNLPDVSVAPITGESSRQYLRSRVQLYNERIAEIARHHALPLVDLYQSSRQAIESRPDFFASDGLHPSDQGYEFWADTMWPAVQEVISNNQ